MSSCQRCKQTSSGPQAFLLTCRGCRKAWHHRCHMPPVEDGDLIKLIRATTAGDTANDLSTWMCRRCKKGTPTTPSAMSNRETTTPSDSREDNKHPSPAVRSNAPTTNLAPTADRRVKELSITVDAQLANDRGRNKKSEWTEAAPVPGPLVDKKPSLSAANDQPARLDVRSTHTKFTPQEKKVTSLAPSRRAGVARKLPDVISAASSDDNAEMQVDPPTPRVTARVPQAPSLARPEPVAGASVRTVSSANERRFEVKPTDGETNPPRVTQDVVDDPDDLYGPPVERRIIRILPSLAEELREQQRRVAAEKEKRRAPLAPDWILAKHVNDPLWKIQENPPEGRKRRKLTARKLGDNGVNVDELMGSFTVRNWVREHRM